jgi:hypothetical protein
MSTQSKITPGKWRVIDGAVISDTILDYGGFIVCSLGREATPQDKANLLKQAAVPEMIEALLGIAERSDCKTSRVMATAALRKAGQL